MTGNVNIRNVEATRNGVIRGPMPTSIRQFYNIQGTAAAVCHIKKKPQKKCI